RGERPRVAATLDTLGPRGALAPRPLHATRPGSDLSVVPGEKAVPSLFLGPRPRRRPAPLPRRPARRRAPGRAVAAQRQMGAASPGPARERRPAPRRRGVSALVPRAKGAGGTRAAPAGRAAGALRTRDPAPQLLRLPRAGPGERTARSQRPRSRSS